MGIRIFIFLSRKLLYCFLGLCDYSDKFPKMFCSSCGGNALQPQISVINVASNLIGQVSNKAASSVEKEKLLNEYFHRGYSYAAIVSLLEKRDGVRMHVRMVKRKLKSKPRKVRRSSLFSLNFYVNYMPFIHYLEFHLHTIQLFLI